MTKKDILEYRNIFKLKISKKWINEEDDNLVTLFKKNGVGAINISVLKKSSKKISYNDALNLIVDFLTQNNSGYSENNIDVFKKGDNFIAVYDNINVNENLKWLIQVVIGLKYSLIMTYNYEISHIISDEEVEVRQIFSSVICE